MLAVIIINASKALHEWASVGRVAVTTFSNSEFSFMP